MSLIAFALLAAAQTASPASPPPNAPPPVDCTDANHTALDFWIGDWAVSPAGSNTVIATSKIEKIADCAISENYVQTVGPGNAKMDYRGRSISAYVPADKQWRQFYVDNSGRAATLTGPGTKGSVVLSQTVPIGLTRMTISANPDGSVRQHGELSKDDGKTWTTSFDFIYRKK
jgi:hypothetical protein